MNPSAFEIGDWYDTPRYYDVVSEEGTREEVDFLEDIVEQHGRRGRRRVLEPACGSGRLVAELASRGWRATGSDISRPMLDFARRRLRHAGLRATLRYADMANFRERRRFELAHCLVSTFKYLPTEADARSHLECVARCLLPNGLYVLGLHLTDYDYTGLQRERRVATRGHTKIVCNIQGWPADPRRRSEKIRSRLVVSDNGVEKRSETCWTFRTYDSRQVRRLLRSVPSLEHVATYDFTYNSEAPCELDDDMLDKVLVLRRL